jgi:ATP synthase protein I
MNAENHRTKQSEEESGDTFSERVAAKQARKLRAQKQRDQSAWFGLGMFGVVGWSVTIPAIVFIAIGIWIDTRSSGTHSWTLMLLIIGIGLGCLNAWFWVSREGQEISRQHQDGTEEDDDDHQ